MDLENQESLIKIEIAVKTIKSREGVEGVSLVHQNGINIKSASSILPDDQFDDIALISSRIFSLTNKIHDHKWEYIILECQYGKIFIIPLFFDQSSDVCPFFLQIVTQPSSNLKNLLLNIQNAIGMIIKELIPINNELQLSDSQILMEINQSLMFEGENPEIGAILSNYFSSQSSLDIETVIVYVDGKFLNSIVSSEIQSDTLKINELLHLRNLLSNSDKLIQTLKNSEITSIRIDFNKNFHFIFPLQPREAQFRESFLSIITKSQSKLGFWHVLVPQVIHKIDNVLN